MPTPVSDAPSTPQRFAVATYDALVANIAILNHQGEILAVNRAWATFARDNGGRDGVGDNYLQVCDATTGEDAQMAQEIAAGIRAVLADAAQMSQTEYPCALQGGMHYFLARVTGFVQDGQPYAVVAHEDITRRKQAELRVQDLNRSLEQRVQERTLALREHEQRLEERNAELEERNLELAQFTYVASHDLQEPLRILGMYNDLLQHRYGEMFDERGQTYLGHIAQQASRARQLVRDVLSFASVSAQPGSESVDLRAVWQEIVPTLPWPENAEIHCQAVPPVTAHTAQMRQLLSNLLGNSLKFKSERPLQVALTAQVKGDWVEFRLDDNGVGIATDHLEKVFLMFHRSHAGTQGNGIGLAVCKKIVERQGGQIRLESRQNEGTCVVFTLPSAAAHSSVLPVNAPTKAAG